MSSTEIPEDQVGVLVEEIFIAVERCQGKKHAKAVRRILNHFISMIMVESANTGISPGELISSFMMVLLEIDKRSDEIAFHSGDCRKN